MGEFLMSLEMQLSGFLFLLIIVILIICDILGHGTISDLNSEAKFQKINENPKKFTISFVLLVLEHICIIFLVVMLFIAFSPFNVLLGLIWVTFRITESSIQIYDKKNYWRLLNIATQYTDASGAEKNEFIASGRSILKKKITIFSFAQILFSIGTLTYSILFVTYEAVPVLIGWFGIVVSIVYGFGSGIMLVKPNFKALGNVGGLLVFIFELVLGGWLLFFS